MSTSTIVCSACARTYQTRNGFARHALSVHQSLGIQSGALLPLSEEALAARKVKLRARDRRRRQREVRSERPVTGVSGRHEDRLMLRTIRILSGSDASGSMEESVPEPPSLAGTSAVRSFPTGLPSVADPSSPAPPQAVRVPLHDSVGPPALPEDLRRQIAAVVIEASLRPGESPEAVSQAAGYDLKTTMDLVIATAVVEAETSLRRVLQPSVTEESLSSILAGLAEDGY